MKFHMMTHAKSIVLKYSSKLPVIGIAQDGGGLQPPQPPRFLRQCTMVISNNKVILADPHLCQCIVDTCVLNKVP